MEELTPQDLDKLSRLIADALQVVDRDQGLNGALIRVRGPGPRDLEGELSDGEEEADVDEAEEKLLHNVPTLNPQESTSVAALQGNFIKINLVFSHN